MLCRNALPDKLSFSLGLTNLIFSSVVLLVRQLMDNWVTDCWLFGSFPVFFAAEVCDCHLCTVELFFSLGSMTRLFKVG